jgi:hypothetical protein
MKTASQSFTEQLARRFVATTQDAAFWAVFARLRDEAKSGQPMSQCGSVECSSLNQSATSRA